MKPPVRRLAIAAALVAAAGGAWWLLRPERVPVEVAVAAYGPLRVTIDEEGQTRVREHRELDAPVTGRVAEAWLRVGDSVAPGMVVARIAPAPIGPRDSAQAVAQLRAAEATLREARTRVEQASTTHDEARRTSARLRALAAAGGVAAADLDRALATEKVDSAELAASRRRAEAAGFEVQRARALVDGTSRGGSMRPVELRAPVGGRVLRLFEEHERVVPAGTPLVEIGDARALEVTVDVLSEDAPAIRPGALMLVSATAGDTVPAHVRLVEPAAFTKLSPLGIEEQRVKVVGDFVAPPARLGTGYRVQARIVVADAPRVLQVPSSALFREDTAWAVFVVARGRAERRRVTVGARSDRAVEILGGVREGERVVLHPVAELRPGARVAIGG